MRQRIFNKNTKSYKHYGGRGINICEEWNSFENFKNWALANGYEESLTLERKKVNEDYCPENCTWISHADQQKNRTNNINVTAWGETKVALNWISDERCKVGYETLLYRIRHNWNHEDAISKPPTFDLNPVGLYEAFGEKKTLIDWSKDPRCLVSYENMITRLQKKWDFEKVISRPKTKPNEKNIVFIEAWTERKSSTDWLSDPRCMIKDRDILTYRIRNGWTSEEAISIPKGYSPVKGKFKR